MTVNAILVLSGQIGSGKSSLARSIEEKFEISRASFGGYVRYLVRKSGGNDEDRAALQDEGEQRVRADPRGFLIATLEFHGWNGTGSIVVDGLRHISILDEMRKLFGDDLRHVHLEADVDISLERAVARGDDARMVERALEHRVEADTTIALLTHADLVLPASEPIERQVTRIALFVSDK